MTPLPGIAIDEKRIVSSTGGLELDKVPKHLVVIGGGYIGLELGSVWRRLGSKVTVVEFLDRITPGMDVELSKELHKVLSKQEMAFELSTKVTSAKANRTGVDLKLEPAAGGKTQTMKADVVLVSVGRRPFTDGLGLDALGVTRDNYGRIGVDATFQTNVAGVYAIGDVIDGPMLAHKASEDGIVCVEMMAGQAGHIDYNLVPGVVYTWPEAAAVGQTEEQLKEAGIAYNTGKFPFMANSRARGERVHRWLRQDPRRQEDRSGSRRPHHRPGRRHHDPRGGGGDGVRWLGGRYRALVARPSDARRGDDGSGARRRRAHDPHLSGRGGLPAIRTRVASP